MAKDTQSWLENEEKPKSSELSPSSLTFFVEK